MIYVVKGNTIRDIALPLQLLTVEQSGETITNYYPSDSDVIEVNMVGAYEKEAMEVTVNENYLHWTWTPEKTGCYGIEVRITQESGIKMRSYRKEQVCVVCANEQLPDDDGTTEFAADYIVLENVTVVWVQGEPGQDADIAAAEAATTAANDAAALANQKAALANSAAETATDAASTVADAVANVNTAIANTRAAINTANNAASSANASAANADAATTAANNAAELANTKAGLANTAATTANTAATNANNKATLANNAATAATNAADLANTKAGLANTAATAANTAAELANTKAGLANTAATAANDAATLANTKAGLANDAATAANSAAELANTKAGLANTAATAANDAATAATAAAAYNNELNISAIYPTDGTDSGNTYTLANAIAKVPSDSRKEGLKVTFISDGSDSGLTAGSVYTYQYVGSSWTTANFQIVPNGLENSLNSSATDKALSAAQGKVLADWANEINVSKAYPTGGTNSGNTYSLANAITKVPSSLRSTGVKVTFISDGSDSGLTSGVPYTFEFQGGTWGHGNFKRSGIDYETGLSVLYGSEKWWKEGDVFKALPNASKEFCGMIKEFKIESYVKGLVVTVAQIAITGSALNIVISFNNPLRDTSYGATISLPLSQTIAEGTYSTIDYLFIAKIKYCTDGSSAHTYPISLSVADISYKENRFTSNENNMPTHIVKSVRISKDVSSIAVKRMQNVSSGGTYIYYNVYVVTDNNNQTHQYISSYTTQQTGIVKDVVGTFAEIYIDSDILAKHGQILNVFSSTQLCFIDISNCDLAELDATSYIRYANNLISDGLESLPQETTIMKGGVVSDSYYGMEDACYTIPLPYRKKYRFFGRYRFTSAVPYVSDSVRINLLTFNDDARKSVRCPMWQRQLADNGCGYLSSQNQIGLENMTYGTALAIRYGRYKPIQGVNAFWMRYTGDVSNTDVVAVFSSSTLTFSHSGGSTIAVINFSGTDSVDSLISSINALTDFEASFIQTVNHTCADLLINDGLAINMVQEVNESYDAPRIYVPYAHDEEWHTLELLIDLDNNMSYAAFDGSSVFKQMESVSRPILCLGGTYNGSDSPIQWKDIEIDCGSWGDAEIITYKSYPQLPDDQRTTTRIVSNHNPYLLIFEGHGIRVSDDANAPTSTEEDLMAVSTDRLMYLFGTLKDKGFLPVSWDQIKEWKLCGKDLPKRCYTLMFDDFRIENYGIQGKRFPFAKYEVKAGLAVLTTGHTRDEILQYDGNSFTLGRVLDNMIRDGWYPTSHTDDHRYIYNDMPSQLPSKLADDISACDLLGIYSDILIYPYGAIDVKHLAPIQESCFKLGVTISSSYPNVSCTNDFYLTRIDIGTRSTLSGILTQIV